MHILTPSNVLKLAQKPDNHFVFDMAYESSQYFLKNKNLTVSQEKLEKAAIHLTEITEIQFKSKDVEDILSLYPRTRIELAEHGTTDTSTRDGLAFMISHFLLGCSWPTYGDNVDIEQFVALLQMQAEKAGYKKVTTTTKEKT